MALNGVKRLVLPLWACLGVICAIAGAFRDASHLPPGSSASAVPQNHPPKRGSEVSNVPTSRIFVVDDELVIASTLATILDMNGFSARSFTRPLEALTAAQEDIPDLLISDVAMPDLSGIDLAIQMTAQHPHCKILLFSGQADTLDLLKRARYQGHHFRLLVKPVFPSELLAEIRKITSDEPVRRPESDPKVGLHLVS